MECTVLQEGYRTTVSRNEVNTFLRSDVRSITIVLLLPLKEPKPRSQCVLDYQDKPIYKKSAYHNEEAPL